ncbi:TPR-like protein [Thozetella sp. PMI_491]|nr:TPR-like protein [Thozetella sp. PMI_491]
MSQMRVGHAQQSVVTGMNYGEIVTNNFHAPGKGYNESVLSASQRLTSIELPENTPEPTSFIPYSTNPDFISRGDLLDQILKRSSGPPGRLALAGLGGIGKSQLAIHFAHRIAESRPDTWVFWVHAASRARFEKAFRDIADNVKLPGRTNQGVDICRLVHQWLSNRHNGKWVLVIDSADDYTQFLDAPGNVAETHPLASYIPQSGHGFTLLTTRNYSIGLDFCGGSANVIQIGPMDPSEALSLLEKKLDIVRDRNAAADLINKLNRIPLALSQAAAYITHRAPRMSIHKYLTDFGESEQRRNHLLNNVRKDLHRDVDQSNAVLNTGLMSIAQIYSERKSAVDLLSLMAFFDPQSIPESILRPDREPIAQIEDADTIGSNYEAGAIHPRGPVPDSTDTEPEFEDDILKLRDYSLISLDTTGNLFSMHSLVQSSIKLWLTDKHLQEKFQDKCIQRLSEAFPVPEHKNWPSCQTLFPHVELVIDYRPTNRDLEEIWVDLLHHAGQYANWMGNYEIAERMHNKEMITCETIYEINHPKALRSMDGLSRAIWNQGRRNESERLTIHVLELSKVNLGVNHEDTLSRMADLASRFRSQGRWKEAEELDVHVFTTYKTTIQVDDQSTLRSMINLANTYRKQGRFKESEQLLLEALEISKSKLGTDHPDTLLAMRDLTSIFRKQGRLKEAEKLGRQALEISILKLGAAHPDTADVMADLAAIFYRQGRINEAEKLQLQALDIQKTKLGTNHPDTLTHMIDLSATFRSQGRLNEAEELQIKVLEAQKATLGTNHPNTLASMSYLANTFYYQGRLNEAEEIELQALETSKAKLGPDHPHTLAYMAHLALTWKDLGREVEALSLMEECVQTRQRVLGPDHPDTISSSTHLQNWREEDL